MILEIGELDQQELDELARVANQYHVNVGEGIYSPILEGSETDILRVTLDMWSMARDEWEENGFNVMDGGIE